MGTNIPVKIEASLKDYPSVVKETTFFVTIKTCEVQTLTAVDTPDQAYIMEVPAVAKTITVNAFKQEP